MRYFLELAYFGKVYHGWQKQPNAVSVQEVVENALSICLQIPIEVVGAGRTDAGVHAKQLFVHFDLNELLPADFLFKLNSLLPEDISILNIFRVKADAHARFDALSRSYEYHIIQKKDPFAFDRSYLVKRNLDLRAMNKASEILKQYDHFKCFSKSRTDVKTYKCKIEEAYWKKNEEKLIFYIKADRFLRNMVRAVVGTLIEIGLGKIEVEKMHEIIKSENRSEAGASVPAEGLFLTGINYPKNIFLD